jgi:hypothetical protein
MAQVFVSYAQKDMVEARRNAPAVVGHARVIA